MKAAPAYWYGNQRSLVYYFLLPVSWLFCSVVWVRRSLYRLGLFPSYRFQVPVVVIGNITVGGSGKTPLVMWLARFLKENGYRPGIVSRGYGGNASSWPQQVRADSDYVVVGDEAVMIAARTECPMAVGPKRSDVIQSLLQHHDVDVVLSDDGMQHYAMNRDIEIAVIDGVRRLGNQQCLPAGPLREKPGRLQNVDMVVVNGIGDRHEHPMKVSNRFAVNLVTSETRALTDFSDKIHVVAGIGNPRRFFDSLEFIHAELETHEFPDHHPYCSGDVEFEDGLPVLMTEKDAVKCVRFDNPNLWCVPASVEMENAAFGQRLLMLLEKRKPQ